MAELLRELKITDPLVRANEIKGATNFQKVKKFMSCFGQELPCKIQHEIPPLTADLRLRLIDEEVDELKDAIKNSDTVEIADALADILYVVYGAAGAFGIDIDEIFDMVHTSNMSKLCVTEQIAQDTVKWYKEHVEKGYPNPIYHPESEYWVVKCGDTGKVLKSINYFPVTNSLEKYIESDSDTPSV